MIDKRPAEYGRFANALGIADQAVVWASKAGDGVTWYVMHAKTAQMDKNTPLFMAEVWATGDQVEVVGEPREIGTFGDFAQLVTLLNKVPGGGDGRVH